MTKDSFLAELENKLRHLPEIERREAMEYYREYFEEAGKDREQEVIAELKSPSHIASKILAEFATKEMNATFTAKKTKTKKQKSGSRGLKVFGFMLLALFAAPIAVPVLIAVVALVFGIFIALIACVVVLVSLMLCCFLLAIILLFKFPIWALFFIGITVFAIGVLFLVIELIRFIVAFILKKLSRSV